MSGLEKRPGKEVSELEHHVHNWESQLGLAATPDGETHRADITTFLPFQAVSGNDTFGPWLQLIGSDDTPIFEGMTKFDLNTITLDDIQEDKVNTLYQIGHGPSGAQMLIDETYTTRIIKPQKADRHEPFDFRFDRCDSGTKVWFRIWVEGLSTKTWDFWVMMHEYLK